LVDLVRIERTTTRI